MVNKKIFLSFSGFREKVEKSGKRSEGTYRNWLLLRHGFQARQA